MEKIVRAMTAGVLMLGAFTPAAFALEKAPDARPATTSCFIPGLKSRVECLDLEVPLDYAQPNGAHITIHAAIVRAKGSNAQPDPIWVFAGGPGQAASDYGILVKSAFERVHGSRDVVLVDQRGTGKSNGLRCAQDPEQVLEALPDWTAFVAECRAGYDIDVRQFTMENVIRDMEVVREALGYDKLNLWGGSWGTRTAGLYYKRYPEHVRSVIVDGVAPPDIALFESAPTSAERAKHLLAEDCAANEACAVRYPDFEAQVDALMAAAKKGELRFKGNDPVTGKPLDIKVNFPMAVESIRSVMYSADSTVLIPYLVDEVSKGNIEPLVAAAASGTLVADSMYLGATLSILCGEELPRTRPEVLAEEASRSFAGDSYYEYWAAACAGWEAIPGATDAHEPIKGDVPTLILSGYLDPITPPEMGERWHEGFPNSRHIVVNGNGHISSNVGCMPRLIGAFVDGLDAGTLDTSCLAHLERLPVVTGINGTVD